jgi:hypothetical protein
MKLSSTEINFITIAVASATGCNSYAVTTALKLVLFILNKTTKNNRVQVMCSNITIAGRKHKSVLWQSAQKYKMLRLKLKQKFKSEIIVAAKLSTSPGTKGKSVKVKE